MSGPNLKLKLNTAQSPPAASPPNSALPTPTLKLNLSRRPSETVSGPPASSYSPIAPPKPARRNTNASNASSAAAKKRKQLDPTASPAAKKTKLAPIRLNSQSAVASSLIRKPSIVKLGKGVKHAQQSPTTPGGGQIRALRVKHKGKLPPRPLGAGYDSEADEAEEDPAIEENFILRMLPGPDCDYVHKAIEERKVGVPISQGGADISLRFFTKDARRAVLKVRDKFYAAVLVDLPCIVESMKSWDRKGWWKSADICQMLLVTEQVNNEDAARHTPLPRELDTKTWQWPHGLTPPMHNVRKRRFRKRVSHKTIEQAELEVERLLAADELAKAHGGSTQSEVLDWEQLRREEEGLDDDQDEDDEDADGDFDVDMRANGDTNSQAVDDDDDADWQAQFEAQLGADDDDEPDTAAGTPAAPATASDSQAPTPAAEAEIEVEADTPSADVQQHVLDEDAQVQTPAEASGSSDEDDEDDDDDDDDDEDDDDEEEEIDEEAREKQQYLAQQREEVAHLDRQIAERREQLAKQTNPLLKAKMSATIKRFEEERDVKKRGLGDADDDD